MKVKLTTVLNAPIQTVMTHLKTPQLLLHISAPLVHFKMIEPRVLPTHWKTGNYKTSLWLFGSIPMGYQVISTSEQGDESGYQLRDNGHGLLAKRWDHLITLKPQGEQTIYTDDIEVEAGLLTLGVWLFAKVFYAHRQRRWRKLVSQGFAYA